MKKIVIYILILCIAVSAAGCSDKANAAGDFSEDNAGTWYCYGNLESDELVINDGTWEYLSAENDEKTITAKGTFSYDKDMEGFKLEDEMSTTTYAVYPVKDGILEFKGYKYLRSENSRSGFDEFEGSWYEDGDREKDYFMFEPLDGAKNGAVKWKFFESQDMGNVSADSGDLVWSGLKNAFIADYGYENFAVLTLEDTGELSSDGKTYILLKDEDIYEEDDSSLQEDIIKDGYYYLNGDLKSESLYFYTIDNTVDLDVPGNDTVEGTYSVSGNILTVSVGNIQFEYEIQGDMLVDEYGDKYLRDSYAEDSELSLSNDLITETWYYVEGDSESGGIYFYTDGNVDIKSPDGDIISSTYSISDSMVRIIGDDVDLELEVVGGDGLTLYYKDESSEDIYFYAAGKDDI